MERVTDVLVRWEAGEPGALDELITVTYDQLRIIARARMRGERRNHTLQPSALVHELYKKLSRLADLSLANRAAFYALSSKIMRNILIDYARSRNGPEGPGNKVWVSFSKVENMNLGNSVDFLELDSALLKLATSYPDHAHLVELKFFGGMTIDQIADVTGLSTATVERRWTFARAWLFRELTERNAIE